MFHMMNMRVLLWMHGGVSAREAESECGKEMMGSSDTGI